MLQTIKERKYIFLAIAIIVLSIVSVVEVGAQWFYSQPESDDWVYKVDVYVSPDEPTRKEIIQNPNR